MASPTASNMRNSFLSATHPEDTNDATSIRARSVSITRSYRSSRSGITVVEENADVTLYNDSNVENTYIIRTFTEPRYTWLDHLLGVFCFKAPKRREPIMTEDFVKPRVPETSGREVDGSPWVLPVFVLSTRNDTDKHKIPQEAKATIDTGNQQGNLVSRRFVESVLEFSEAHFCRLTEEEQRGGTGVTGHKLIPDGAIYLTWYSKKSVRVFRNMRFLIVPIENYDLIIGARSAYKDKLLDVPNFMALGRTAVNSDGPEDKTRNALSDKCFTLRTQVGDLDTTITETKREIKDLKKQIAGSEDNNKRKDNLTAARNALKQDLESAITDLDVAKKGFEIASKELDIYDIEHNKTLSGAKKAKLLQDLQIELEALPGYVKTQELPRSDTSLSTSVQPAEESSGGKRRPHSNKR